MTSPKPDRGGDRLAYHLAEEPVERIAITCLPDLARATRGGFRIGDTSVVGGFPKRGKSALLEQIALDVSIEHDTLFLPLEMGVDDAWLRLAAKIERRPPDFLETQRRIDASTRAQLNARRLWVRAPEVGRAWTLRDISNLIEAHHAKFVIIDHVRWIAGWYDGAMTATKMAQELRVMAQILGVHIMQAAQLKIEDVDKKPSMWRVQDTAALTQLTAFEVLVNRPYYGQGSDRDKIVELIVRSNRWGPSGMSHVRWEASTQTMWHLTPEDFDNFDCSCKDQRRRRKPTR